MGRPSTCLWRGGAGAILAWVLASTTAFAAGPSLVTGQSADNVLGQSGFTSGNPNKAAGLGPWSLNGPNRSWTDGTRLFVADRYNNRVLIYNTIPTVNNAAADVVIGQPDMTSNGSNQGGVAAANTLAWPQSIYSDGTRLFVSDRFNNRVLIYNTIPTVNNAAADVVIGQPDMTSNGSNQGGAAAANTLGGPESIYSAGTRLFVTDYGNHRVLIYNTIPIANNAAANVVIGQLNMTSSLTNQGGAAAANTLNSPKSIYSDGTRLLVTDYGNHRVLIYNTIPIANNAAANVVIGQPDMTSSLTNQGGAAAAANTLATPESIYSDGTRLFAADLGNSRVLIYNTIPTVNNAAADVVIGQPNMTSNTGNQGGAAAANTLASPGAINSNGTKLFVADIDNHRVLIYNTIPTVNNAAADVVIGQPDMASASDNQSFRAASADGLRDPSQSRTDGTRLFVADYGNSRVLIYNTVPTANNAAADVVVGQPDMTSSNWNQGGAAAANTLDSPTGIYLDGTRLFVADRWNHRVLIYNTIPTVNNAAADVVIGQPDMTSNGSNQGGVAAANTLAAPYSIYSDGTRLFVADINNHRVLIYNTIPTANNAAADVVIGQPDMTSNGSNQGGAAAANTLNSPESIYSDGTRLFVVDRDNSRVLIYNTIPTVNNAAADVVIGQPNMTSNIGNQGGAIAANTLSYPSFTHSDGTRLFVVDGGNHRVMIYNTIPTVNNAAAAIVLGQAVMTSGQPNRGAATPGAVTLNYPSWVWSDAGRLYVSDSGNNRVLIYGAAPAAPPSSASANIGPGGGSVAFGPTPGPVNVSVPPGAFSETVGVTLQSPSSFACNPSPLVGLQGVGVGVSITLDKPFQPAKDVVVSVSYLNAALPPGTDESKLILARCDTAGNVWVPLVSTADAIGKKVSAKVNHFSIFQIMQTAAAGSVSTAKAFPNPFRPSQGQTSMTFAALPAGARIRIYTLTGQLVKDLSADAVGLAAWDGTNQSGEKAVSGVYFVFAQGEGQKRTFKVIVQR